ncbi:MAG: zinc metallopeptidase [Verrucomicrobiae bacterium]|nr:zinc metallopeptidase [Verrucomicrobiae bacterium]
MQLFLLFFLLTLVTTMWAKGKYRKAYDEELKNIAASGLTGADLARMILQARGIEVVEIVRGKGLFADYYDPEHKRLFLAPQHYGGSTFTALGIAAHEAGHVLQHRDGHQPLQWRISAIRATIFLSLPIAALGLFMMIVPGMAKMGVYLLAFGWSLVAGYNLVTLPVELDASERARQVLDTIRPFRNLDERLGVERMMRAASAAYVDGVFTVISWLGSWFLPSSDSEN